jgi:hypothetical protein
MAPPEFRVEDSCFAAVRAESQEISHLNISIMTFSSSVSFGAPHETDHAAQTLAITLLKDKCTIYRLYVHYTTSNFCVWMFASTQQEAAVGYRKTLP